MGTLKLHCLDPEYSTTRRVLQIVGAGNSLVTDLTSSAERLYTGGLRKAGFIKHSGLAPKAGLESRPLISVITVCYNALEHIESTILSVLKQTYDNVEYLVIDGGSTDGTVDIIRNHERCIDVWVSERDEGIYDAMNKGIALASGDYVALLNASDWYEPDLLSKVVAAMCTLETKLIIYCNYELFYEDLNVYEKRRASLAPLRGMGISHQAMFVNARVYKEIGVYDLSYKLASDYEFLLRAYRCGVLFRYVDEYGVFFRTGGRSATSKRQSISEAARALANTCGRSNLSYLRFVLIEYAGLLTFTYLKGFLSYVLGDRRVTNLRKLRRRLF